MRNKFSTSRLALSVLATFCALVFTTTASAKNPKEVKMTIKDDKLVITTAKGENDCPWYESRDAGCIKVKKNKKSEIYFHLTGDTKCTLESGTDWELNAVYLGGYNSESKPGKFGFETIPDPDYNNVNDDFNIADRKSGLVTTIDKSAKKLAINDENQKEYVVWYKIEAVCKRTDEKPAHITTTDPRVKNGGID